MDSISRLAVFAEVVTQGSFSGAGKILGLTGPAVSKQIQKLENELGVKLLTRTTRHVSTTEEGQHYFNRIRNVLADLEEARVEIQESREVPSGRLKLNVPTSFGITHLAQPLAQFARRHPQVQLDIDYNDGWVDVAGDGYDLVVRIAALEDSNLVARRIGGCPILLCASPDFIAEHGSPQQAQDIENLPAIVYTQHGQVEEWRYASKNNDASGAVRLNRVFAANSGEQQLAACLAGVGLALLPIFLVARELREGKLVQLLPQLHTVPERSIYLMYTPNKFLPTRVRMLIDWLAECSLDYEW